MLLSFYFLNGSLSSIEVGVTGLIILLQPNLCRRDAANFETSVNVFARMIYSFIVLYVHRNNQAY